MDEIQEARRILGMYADRETAEKVTMANRDRLIALIAEVRSLLPKTGAPAERPLPDNLPGDPFL